MQEQFDFQYELVFNSNFDLNVILNSSAPHKNDANFQAAVQDKINTMSFIFTLQPGINTFSSYLDFNSTTYKITLIK